MILKVLLLVLLVIFSNDDDWSVLIVDPALFEEAGDLEVIRAVAIAVIIK